MSPRSEDSAKPFSQSHTQAQSSAPAPSTPLSYPSQPTTPIASRAAGGSDVDMSDPNEAARIREKAREAQDQVRQPSNSSTPLIFQAAAAQANLHHAAQQARVATINATATQAALDTATNSSSTSVATAQPLRKTAGRYALADFQIERT